MFSTTEPDGYVEPRIAKSGQGSIEAKTVIQVFQETVAKHGMRPALFLKRPVNGVVPTEWRVWTWQHYWEDCFAFAKALVHLKVGAYKVINIIGFNSPEWLITNNGSIMASGIAAGIYSTNSPEACEYVTSHSKAEVVVVEGNKQLAKYTDCGRRMKHVKAIVVWGEDVDPATAKAVGVPVYTWDDFLLLGADVSDAAVEERWTSVRPGNCSSLIYTSGTTGNPKAVMISHDNITWTTKTLLDIYVPMNHTDRGVSYLPLSHIAAQIIDIHLGIYLGSSTYFAQTDALKGSLTTTLKEVRPTFFFGVPRVWEKIQEKMVQMGRETTGVLKVLSTWAKGMGSEHSRLAQFGNGGGAPCGYNVANALVLSKIKAALGLDCTKVCFTAAAPISVDTLNYFASLDIPVYEVFGQSECTGPHTVSAPGEWRIGYCGRPMPGTETMIAEGTKELCYRGRHIFMGYMYMPEQTAATIDSDGYLHSGDVADFDDNNRTDVPAPSGFMKITGRIKELIITAGGENVAQVLIENDMKAEMVALSNCMVIGDRRKYLTMLVSLKTTVDAATGEPTDVLAQDALFVGGNIGSSARTVAEAAACPHWTKYINDGTKAANKKAISNAQIVQKWKLLPVDFSEKAGDLTPTLKLKRSVVAAKYSDMIEEFYAGDN